jgi:hypothetical protein
MRIVTIMNYADQTEVDMCRIWFYLIERFNPGVHITVFHSGAVAGIQEFGARYENVSFVALDMSGVPSHKNSLGYGVPSQELILSMWRHCDRQGGFEKHLFIEADAFVLCRLDDLWVAADAKPYISVEELIWKDGLPLINTGVHTYNSRAGFVTYDLLLEQHRIDGGQIHLPVGEQGLINAYFRRIGYDCRHPDIGFEWNCWPVNCKTVQADDNDIIIVSGDADPSRWPGGHPWSWWGQHRRAKILHAFMAKFWVLPECKRLWDYCLDKVNSM